MRFLDLEDGFQIFVGEVGVKHSVPLEPERADAGGEYDRNDPSGSSCGRRNYGQSCYASGGGLIASESDSVYRGYRTYRKTAGSGTSA